MSLPPPSAKSPRERGVFCNRTLNLRAIRAIGYDMDYTLVHYAIETWEARAFDHVKRHLAAFGLPVGHLKFDPTAIIRGLVIDTKLGNIVKPNRFGYVKRAQHGTRLLSFEDLRAIYAREIVDLNDRRWVFLNTLFSLSEAFMFAELVNLLDAGELPSVRGYQELYELTRKHVDRTHMEGELKAEIIAQPEEFVVLDRHAAAALLDQRLAKKSLMLITNSEWNFTKAMMSYSFDRFLPKSMTWRDLFDIVIVAANKPDFFSSRAPVYEIATEEGLLRPARVLHVAPRDGGAAPLTRGAAYYGGNASLVEQSLGLSGDEILYVGDHLFGDVNVTKQILRWRTALIVRELEAEMLAWERAKPELDALEHGMAEKTLVEARHAETRLELTRLRAGFGTPGAPTEADLVESLAKLKGEIQRLDELLGPLAKRTSELSNPNWGPLMWAGNDKSHFARQVERYADVYTSRVSNFMYTTPFAYLRSTRGGLPHEPHY